MALWLFHRCKNPTTSYPSCCSQEPSCAAFKLPLMFSDALTLRNILLTAGIKPDEDLKLVQKQFGDRCFFTIKHWCKHWSRTLFDPPLQFKNSSQRQEKKCSSVTLCDAFIWKGKERTVFSHRCKISQAWVIKQWSITDILPPISRSDQ